MKNKFLYAILIVTPFYLTKVFANTHDDCSITEYSIFNYMLNDDMLCGESINSKDVRGVIKVINEYWIETHNNKQRYELLSSSYKKFLKEEYNINTASDYQTPTFSFEKMNEGYKILTLTPMSKSTFEAVLEVRWFEEGYRGYQTFRFIVEHKGDKWLISSIYI